MGFGLDSLFRFDFSNLRLHYFRSIECFQGFVCFDRFCCFDIFKGVAGFVDFRFSHRKSWFGFKLLHVRKMFQRFLEFREIRVWRV